MLGFMPPNLNFAGVNPTALAIVLFNHVSVWGNKLLYFSLQYIRRNYEISFMHFSLGLSEDARDVSRLPKRSMAHKEPGLVGRWLLSSVIIALFGNLTLLTGVTTRYEFAHLASKILKVVSLHNPLHAFFYP
jgi:hypothetical protein